MSTNSRGHFRQSCNILNRSGHVYASLLTRMGASVIVFENHGVVNKQIQDLNSQFAVCKNLASLKSAIEKVGKVNLVVTTCEPHESRYFDSHNTETWTHTVDSSLTSIYQLFRLLWPFFQKQKQGKVVLEISPVGIYGHPGQSAFSSAVSLSSNSTNFTLIRVFNRC